MKATGQIIGMISLMNVSEKNRNAEIGYWLGKKYWGKGYATEAVSLILRYGFKELKLFRIWARVFHPNLTSIRLLEKVGFTLEGRLRNNIKKSGRWLDELCYGILKTEYKK